ncbi:MAG: hypothetical protein IKK24_05795, partial [Clostridia bacterium]|nr:hypothetical protein [Clostridia bacterium]
MKANKFNNKLFKVLATLLAVIMLLSAVAVIQLGVTADNGGDWDYKAYIPDENLVYPTQSIISGGWGWPATVTQTTEYLEFKYNSAVPYQYTAAIDEISFDKAHIKLAVENATHYYIGFGHKQQHPGSNKEIAFKIDKNADSFAVTIGSEIQVLQNFTYADDNLLDIKLEKADSGYKFIFDDSFTYTLTNELLNSKANLKNIFSTGKVWFNISPNNTTPTFKIYSVHGGDQVCYDELSNSYSADDMNSIFGVIDSINAIDSAITSDSKDDIEAARAAYDALDEDLKQYISNYNNLTYAEDAYIAAAKSESNIDGVLYEAVVNKVGPNHHWPAETVDWFEAESGTGVTIQFNNTHWHNVGLTHNNNKSLDGVHIRFGKGTYKGTTGENFGLIFDQSLQIQMEGQQKDLCLAFEVKDTGIKISYGVDSGAKAVLIDTALIKKATFENGWDIRFDKQDDGSYLVTLNGSVSGVIPKDVIDAAVAKGLDVEKMNVTLAGNTATPSGKLYVDFLSIHD